MSGAKIIAAMKDALAGNYSRVEMEGRAFIQIDQRTRHAANAKVTYPPLNARGTEMPTVGDLMMDPVATLNRCCLTTPDPGKWQAGVDDTADPAMVKAMHNIRDRLSHRMPLIDLIWALKAAVQIDSRTRMGHDIQNCLLSN